MNECNIFYNPKYLLITCFLLFISSCTSNHIPVKPHTVASKTNIKQTLYTQFMEWKSVKYRFGGLSKDGIDCSGFVYLTFRDSFGIELPRTTKQQLLSGETINDQADLKAGDLVFFKTGMQKRHVGIYLEKNKFLHVSTKNGVSISRLDNSYWRKRYWQAVRVL